MLSKITIVPLYWLLFVAEACVVIWVGRRAQFEAGHSAGDGPVMVALAVTMSLLLALDAMVFHFIEDRRIRQVAFGALLVPTVLPMARMLAG